MARALCHICSYDFGSVQRTKSSFFSAAPTVYLQVGSALVELLSEGVVRRDQLFITSKLWNSNHAASAVRSALEKTLGDLGVSGEKRILVMYAKPWFLDRRLQTDFVG